MDLKIYPRSCLAILRRHAYNLYLITIDDTPTFVIPNTVFGLTGALTNSFITYASNAAPPQFSIVSFCTAVLHTLLFNWTNLLIFDLANQRAAGPEDSMNKPWRPIPSKRMSSIQMRHWLILAIPLVVGYNWTTGVGTETCFLVILTWIYNDLGGGDDNWIVRNLVIACAFGHYNLGSLKVASNAKLSGTNQTDTSATVSKLGYCWIILVSSVIFTTMHVQDLKDIDGDLARGRRTAPILYGRRITGWTIALPLIMWSVVCGYFWRLTYEKAMALVVFGSFVAWRCIALEGKREDRWTWQLWSLWTGVLYLTPLSCS